MREAFLAAERSGAATIPPRSAAMFNVNERDRAWVDAQCTPQPVKCGLQAVTLTGARERIAKKSYIRATAYPSQPFDLALAKARARGWRSHEVACGHDVMLDAPERLAEILLTIGAGRVLSDGSIGKLKTKTPGQSPGALCQPRLSARIRTYSSRRRATDWRGTRRCRWSDRH